MLNFLELDIANVVSNAKLNMSLSLLYGLQLFFVMYIYQNGFTLLPKKDTSAYLCLKNNHSNRGFCSQLLK